MFKVLLTGALLSLFTGTAWASGNADLTAVPMSKILKEVSRSHFTFKEQGKLFGYISTESCLYVSADFALLRHYCYPKGEKPAASYTIISSKYGILQMYQEQLGPDLRQETRINVFPEHLKTLFKGDLRTLTITELNVIYRSVYEQQTPSCWSNNFSQYTGEADTRCYVTDVALYPEWAKDAQGLVSNNKSWAKAMANLLKKTP